MQRKDILIGIIVVSLWGLSFIAIKLGLRDMPPMLLAAVRFLVAVFPVILFVPRPPIAWRWLIMLGLFLNVGQFIFLHLGIKLGMPAGLSSLVHQSQVFFTMVFAAVWLGERWQRHNIIGMVLAVCGIMVIGLQQGAAATAAGFWITLIGSASWGMGNVIMRRATFGVPPFSMLALVVWAGAVAILPLALLSLLFEGFGAWQAAYRSINPVSFGSVVYLSYFAILGGYGLWGVLLSRYPASVVSPFSLLIPVVGMGSCAWLLGESLNVIQGLGALLVMGGLTIHVLGKKLFGNLIRRKADQESGCPSGEKTGP